MDGRDKDEAEAQKDRRNNFSSVSKIDLKLICLHFMLSKCIIASLLFGTANGLLLYNDVAFFVAVSFNEINILF